jgi:hypothetical protein
MANQDNKPNLTFIPDNDVPVATRNKKNILYTYSQSNIDLNLVLDIKKFKP